MKAGSDAERELAEFVEAGLDRGLLQDAIDSGLKSLYASEDFLGAAAGRIADPACPFSSISLMRSSLEASARARWLFAPSLDALRRSQRFARDANTSVSKARGIAIDLGVDLDAGQEAQLNAIEEKIERFAESIKGWTEKPAPSGTNLVRALLEDEYLGMQPPGADIVYRTMSSGAHADKLGLDNFLPGTLLKGESDPPDDHPEGLFELFGWAAGWGYVVAAHRTFAYLGWDHSMWLASAGEFGARLDAVRTDADPRFNEGESAAGKD